MPPTSVTLGAGTASPPPTNTTTAPDEGHPVQLDLTKRRRAGRVLVVIAAAMALFVSGWGMWTFFGHILGPGRWYLILPMFLLFDVAGIACAFNARINRLAYGRMGIEGWLVWAFAAASGAMSASEATGSESAIRFAAPMVAAILFELLIRGERKDAQGRTDGPLDRIKRRVLARLGLLDSIGQSDEDAAKRAAAGRLATRAYRMHQPSLSKRARRRAEAKFHRKLRAATERLQFSSDAEMIDAVRLHLAALYQSVSGTSAAAVADLNLWKAANRVHGGQTAQLDSGPASSHPASTAAAAPTDAGRPAALTARPATADSRDLSTPPTRQLEELSAGQPEALPEVLSEVLPVAGDSPDSPDRQHRADEPDSRAVAPDSRSDAPRSGGLPGTGQNGASWRPLAPRTPEKPNGSHAEHPGVQTLIGVDQAPAAEPLARQAGEEPGAHAVTPASPEWRPTMQRLHAAVKAELRPGDGHLAGRGVTPIVEALALQVPQLNEALIRSYVTDYMLRRSGQNQRPAMPWEDFLPPAGLPVDAPQWRPAVERLHDALAATLQPEELRGQTGRGVIQLTDELRDVAPELGEATVQAFIGDYVLAATGQDIESGFPWDDLMPSGPEPDSPRTDEALMREHGEKLLKEYRTDGRLSRYRIERVTGAGGRQAGRILDRIKERAAAGRTAA